MGKKIDRDEAKKECPSCGLGVSLEAKICEFCGWDFEEEDEWILQIEKLERELMLEKKKFEPGTVDHKIETTLRTPSLEKAEASQSSEEAPEPVEHMAAAPAETASDLFEPAPGTAEEPSARMPEPVVEAPPAQKVRKVRSVRTPAPAPEAPPEPAPEPERAVPAEPAPKVRKVRTARQKPPEPQPEQTPTRKVRAIRKVKG